MFKVNEYLVAFLLSTSAQSFALDRFDENENQNPIALQKNVKRKQLAKPSRIPRDNIEEIIENVKLVDTDSSSIDETLPLNFELEKIPKRFLWRFNRYTDPKNVHATEKLYNNIEPYFGIIEDMAKKYKISKDIISTIMLTETGGNPKLGYGLMQITPALAPTLERNYQMYGRETPIKCFRSQEEHIECAAMFLSKLYKKIKDLNIPREEIYLAVAGAYNIGNTEIFSNHFERKRIKTIWDLREGHIPKRTLDYISKVVAWTYILNHPEVINH